MKTTALRAKAFGGIRCNHSLPAEHLRNALGQKEPIAYVQRLHYTVGICKRDCGPAACAHARSVQMFGHLVAFMRGCSIVLLCPGQLGVLGPHGTTIFVCLNSLDQ